MGYSVFIVSHTEYFSTKIWLTVEKTGRANQCNQVKGFYICEQKADRNIATLYNATNDNIILAKRESGETMPDIEKCMLLAELYNVTLDDLVNYTKDEMGLNVPPKGKHVFGVVTVGDKGQIVIPHKARKIFQIQSGDRFIVLGDEYQGIELIKEPNFLNMVNEIRKE